MCKEGRLLLVISAIFTFAMGLADIFVSVFFWRETKNFNVIVIYNLMHYITAPITLFLAGFLAKRKNGIWSLRVGLLLFALFYILILYIGNKGLIYIYLLGVLNGMAAAFYWLAYNTLSFDFTDTTNRDTFNGFDGFYCGIAAAVAPIISGFIISRYRTVRGYSIVFGIALTLFVVLIFISMLIKCINYGSRLNVRSSISRNCKEWSAIRKATFIWGFRDAIIIFLVNILIIQTTKSELSLGELSLISSLLSSGSYVLVQKIIKPPKRRLSILIGTAFAFISVIGLIFKVSYSTLLFYTVVESIFLPFFLIQLSSASFNVISRAHDDDLRIEYMINKDVVLGGGRIISSILLLVFLTNFKDSTIIKLYLLFLGIVPLISGYFLSKLRSVLEGK